MLSADGCWRGQRRLGLADVILEFWPNFLRFKFVFRSRGLPFQMLSRKACHPFVMRARSRKPGACFPRYVLRMIRTKNFLSHKFFKVLLETTFFHVSLLPWSLSAENILLKSRKACLPLHCVGRFLEKLEMSLRNSRGHLMLTVADGGEGVKMAKTCWRNILIVYAPWY